MKKKKEQTLFDDLYVKFLGSNPDAQTQDILRIATPKEITSLHFKLILRHPSWNTCPGQDFREISVMRSDLHYVNVLCTQGTFSDMIHAETMEQAMDAIYKYMAALNFKRSALFESAVVFAQTLKNTSNSGVAVSEFPDRVIIRDKTVKYPTELHIQQTGVMDRVKLCLYANGEQVFCSVPQTDEQLINKATYILFGGGPVEDALPKLFRHEVKAITQMLEKHNVNLDSDSITFSKEDFFSFVSDLIRHYGKGES